MKIKLKNKKVIILIVCLLAIGLVIVICFSLLKNKQQEICADDLLDVQYHQRDRYDIDGIINVSVMDKNTGKETLSFSISDTYERHYHFIEIHNCFIYLIKQFGVDYEKKSLAPDYRRELWRYNLYGEGEKIFPINGQVQGIDFRVT